MIKMLWTATQFFAFCNRKTKYNQKTKNAKEEWEMFLYKFYFRKGHYPTWFELANEQAFSKEEFQEMVDEAVAEAGKAPVAITGYLMVTFGFRNLRLQATAEIPVPPATAV